MGVYGLQEEASRRLYTSPLVHLSVSGSVLTNGRQVLSNTLTTKTPIYVTKAALAAGVPQGDITRLLTELTDIPTLTANFGAEVVAAVGYAQQLATAYAIKLVALTSMGFGIIGTVTCRLWKPANIII